MNIIFPRRGRTYASHYSAEQAKKRHEFNHTFFFWLMVVISLGLTAYTYHTYSIYKDIQQSLNDIDVHEVTLTPNSSFTNTVIHLSAPQTTIHPQKPLSDVDFNLNIYGPFSLKREVEYCQWMEHQSTRTIKHSDGSETEETTYYYTKGWHSTTIPSLFFNQPGNHHNPQRDPYPSRHVIDSTDVTIGNGYVIDSNLAKYVNVKSEPVVNWDQQSYDKFTQSAAHKIDNFYYTNNNGWFYSPYTPSVAERLAKTAVQFMEGSLFDFQIGDLFSQCTAGDIRVRYRTKTPEGGVSLIGRQTDSKGRVNTFTSIDNREVDVIYEGMHGTEELKRMKISDTFKRFVWFSVGCVVAWVVTGLVLQYKKKVDREMEDNHEKYY